MKSNVDITVTSSGFDLLLNSFIKPIELNLSLASFNDGKGSIDLFKQKFQIEKQFFEGTIINEIDPLSLEFVYSKLGRKKVEVSFFERGLKGKIINQVFNSIVEIKLYQKTS